MYIIKLKGKLMLLLLSIGLVSCQEYLEVIPKDQVSDGNVWRDTTDADLFLNNIYAGLPGIIGNDPIENLSDNAINGVNKNYHSVVYAKSEYTPENAISN